MGILLRKLIVGVIIILSMSFLSGIVFFDQPFFSVAWVVFLYMSPAVLLLGIPASIVSDFVNKKVVQRKRVWLSLLLHSGLALFLLLIIVLIDALLVSRPYGEQFELWSGVIVYGVATALAYALVDDLFKRKNWFYKSV